MTGLLRGLMIVEHGAFIAGPYSTLSLARLGADVIRIDPIGGSIDYGRWPLAPSGRSLYWAGLNKGKKSVLINLRSPEGQELAQRIVTATGEDRGLFVSNLPAKGWMAYETLRSLRQDLIMISIVGNYDGSTALDYTVNSAVGFPDMTGQVDGDGPVNHVLPAWDLLCGMTAATTLLAAERFRQRTGKGQRIGIALSDVGLATVADLGLVGEVELEGHGRPRYGNDIYGAYGRDFELKDGRRVMVAAVSEGQWVSLCSATGTRDAIAKLEQQAQTSFRSDTHRFAHRDAITAVFAPWFAARTLAEVRTAFDQARVCWGPYQTVEQLVAEDPRCSPVNPLFEPIDHPGIGTLLTPRAAALVESGLEVPALSAPVAGQDTDHVLADVLGLPAGEIAKLHDRGIVDGAG